MYKLNLATLKYSVAHRDVTVSLQTLRLADQSERLAWLAQHIPGLPGTGKVYVLTIRDAEQVADWLNGRGIESLAYYGSVDHDDYANGNLYRQHLEGLLLSNEIKVLVSTTDQQYDNYRPNDSCSSCYRPQLYGF